MSVCGSYAATRNAATVPASGRAFFTLLALCLAFSAAAEPVVDDTQSFFVDITIGNDTNAGTMAAPFRNIATGIVAAATDPTKKSVLVSLGVYPQGVTLALVSGVSVYGQYNRALGWARSPAYVTTISGPPTAVQAIGYTALGVLEGFSINAASAVTSGQNSIGISLNNASALRIRNNNISSGNGAPGVNGNSAFAPGAPGNPGSNGQFGTSGSASGGQGGVGGSSTCSAAGGNGGQGGYNSASGSAGAVSGSGTPGGGGGLATGACFFQSGTGGFGSSGPTGANGAGGIPGSGGIVSGTDWISSAGGDGNAGLNGAGGGGGGGGGGGATSGFICNGDTGGGGGGGGAGGCSGQGGTGGTGGGGSFAIFAVNSTGVMITNNILSMGSGGSGGPGGNGSNGGSGGLSGSGGSFADDAGGGGAGGSGGNGGSGGGGGGGAGGPVYGVFVAGTLSFGLAANNIPVIPGGQGGAAGLPNGNVGASGLSGTTNANAFFITDITPTGLAFTAQTGVPLSSLRLSNTATITGLASTAPIWIAGGEYSIGCTATFTAADGIIANNDTVCVRHTSSPLGYSNVVTTLSIGGTSANFVSTTALTLVSVQSRKTHGSAGTFNVPIDTAPAITGNITIEPRTIDGSHLVVFQFDGPISAAGNVSVIPVGSATAARSGNEVLVTLTNIPDNQRVTVTLTNVNGSVNPPAVSIGFLVGDVTNSHAVNAADISAVKANVNKTVTSDALAKFDLNANGSVTPADVSAVKARSGLVLPP